MQKKVVLVLAVVFLTFLQIFLWFNYVPNVPIVTARASDTGTVSFCINSQPVIQSIQSQSATAEIAFSYQVIASDDNIGQTLAYSDNTALFDINSATGLISFTPTNEQQGNYTITITVSDGLGCSNSEASTIFALEIIGYEPTPPSPRGRPSIPCVDECSPGEQYCVGQDSIKNCWRGSPGGCYRLITLPCGEGRMCVDNECVCGEKWTCEEWNVCEKGTQKRQCVDENACGSTYNRPAEIQSCISCDDGIQNQGEEGVDCGGPCSACTPVVEQPKAVLPEGVTGPSFAGAALNPRIVIPAGIISILILIALGWLAYTALARKPKASHILKKLAKVTAGRKA